MAGLSASGLKTQIRSYTEVDSNVLSDSVLENIILNAQYRIFRDVPIDADRKQQSGNLVPGQETINAPAGAVIIRGIQVYDSSAVLTGSNIAKAAGYTITTGLYVNDARNTSDFSVANFFHFTVDTDTATKGGVKGGGEGCSVGPVTLSA